MPKCLHCDNSTYCNECITTYVLNSSSNGCLLSCYLEAGTYSNKIYPEKCLKCSDAIEYCESCTSSSYCVKCTTGYYLSLNYS